MATLPNPVPTTPQRNPRFTAIAAGLVVLLAGWAVYAFFFAGTTPKTIVLLGVDEHKTRTDVVMVARVVPKTGVITVLSIPRDTLVEIPCAGLDPCKSPDKLAHAHAFGGSKGPAVAVKTVEAFLGVPIDGYVRLDFAAFEKAVDALGGVDIVIDQNMYYEDPTANPPLVISFQAKKEPQHLNGKQALGYVRYRNDGLGDIGRTERTRKFLVALLAGMQKSGIAAKAPSIATAMLPYVTTNLNSGTIVALARVAPKVDPAKVQMGSIPGVGFIEKDSGAWVWKADEAKKKQLVEELIKNPKPPAVK